MMYLNRFLKKYRHSRNYSMSFWFFVRWQFRKARKWLKNVGDQE